MTGLGALHSLQEEHKTLDPLTPDRFSLFWFVVPSLSHGGFGHLFNQVGFLFHSRARQGLSQLSLCQALA